MKKNDTGREKRRWQRKWDISDRPSGRRNMLIARIFYGNVDDRRADLLWIQFAFVGKIKFEIARECVSH